MKVHRIITTIEVENDNSITSVELINLYPANADIPLVITNLTNNEKTKDNKQENNINDDCRGHINDKLKSIDRGINTALTQSGVCGESPIEPDSISKTS